MRFGKWKSDSGRVNRLLVFIAVTVLVLAIGSALTVVAAQFGVLKREPASCPQGTRVNGVDIGGVTKARARELIGEVTRQMLADYRCTVNIEGMDSVTLKAEDIDLKTDIDSVLDSAMKGGEYSLSYKFSPYAVRRSLTEIAKRADTEPQPPYYAPVNDAEEAAVTGRFILKGGRNGRALNIEACLAMITDGADEIEAPFVEITPESFGFAVPEKPKLLGEFTTSFASGALSAPNRVANIKKAAALVNGAVVGAGRVFSCNEVLGPRKEALGWLPAPGITRGGADTADQPGGGVCQVSTTLFNAVLLADMDIVYRQGHSRMVSYAEGGRDATIDTDSIDFKWKNSSPGDVYVFCWTDESLSLHCRLFGTPVTDCRVEVLSELVETVPPGKDEYIEDPSLQPWAKVLENEALAGRVYNTYRVFYRQGRECERELVSETRYNMHPRRFRVGSAYYAAVTRQTQYASAPTPAPTSAPTPAPVGPPSAAPTQQDITPAPTPQQATPEPTPEPTHLPADTPAPPEETEAPTPTPEPTELPPDD